MDFIIQKATVADMPGVMELIQELAIFENEEDAVEVTVEDLKKDGFGPHPLFTCFVAKANEEILGIALVYNRYSTWKGKTVHLEDLVVKKDLRGKGIGSALYQRVMQFAKEQNVRRVEWNVLDWNTPAVEFYKSSGADILQGWQVVQMNEQNLNTFLEKNSAKL